MSSNLQFMRNMIRDASTFESFREHDFRWYYIAMINQNSAMNISMVARSFVAYEITGSFTALGLMALSNAIPMIFFSPIGGVLADRFPKRLVLQGGQLFDGIAVTIIAVLLTAGILTFTHLLLMGLAHGAAVAFMMPARNSMIPELVGEERMMNAVALGTASMNGTRMIAPAIAGFMLAFLDWSWVFYLMGFLYFAAMFSMMPIPINTKMHLSKENFVPTDSKLDRIIVNAKSGINDIREAIKYVRATPVVGMILIIHLFVSTLSMPYQHLLPGFVKDVLFRGPEWLGTLTAITALGSFICALIVASLPNRRRGILFIIGLLILGSSMLAFSVSSILWIAIVTSFVIGIGQTSRYSLTSVLLMSYTEDVFRGRVMSIYMMEFGLVSFGTFAIAMMADVMGIQWAFIITSVGLLVLSLYLLIAVPKLRNLD
ncbi:MAG: MFS transporter [Dehalococcoidia bacterium]